MKRKALILVVFLMVATYVVQAQYSYKPFRFDVGMGLSIPTSSINGIGAGFLLALEPKYSIINKVSVGFRMELNMMFQAGFGYDYYGDPTIDNLDVKVNNSYLITGDYHFTTGTFRPFVGLGLGMYQLAGGRVESSTYDDDYYNDVDIRGRINFGGMLRAGFDVTHFRFALEYNHAGYNYGISHNYFAITVAGYFGGGKKKDF